MTERMNLNMKDLEMVNGGACEATCHDELTFNTEYDGHTCYAVVMVQSV